MTDMSVSSQSKTLENPTNELGVLKKTVKELFEKFLNDSSIKQEG